MCTCASWQVCTNFPSYIIDLSQGDTGQPHLSKTSEQRHIGHGINSAVVFFVESLFHSRCIKTIWKAVIWPGLWKVSFVMRSIRVHYRRFYYKQNIPQSFQVHVRTVQNLDSGLGTGLWTGIWPQ